jgi:hypothetical protein
MNRTYLLASLTLVLASCSTGKLSRNETLDLYKAHTGDSIQDFRYFGHISGWVPLGDSAMAVYTKPNQAYFLELDGPCAELSYAPTITLTNMMNRVSARLDSVYVHSGATFSPPPCRSRISTIRLIDVKGLKQAKRELREAKTMEREATAG